MSNLTIIIDDELLRAARVKAVLQGTSVNEVCRQAIAAYALDDKAQAVARAHARARAFLELSNSVKLGHRPDSERKLSRDELYEEMFAEKSPLARKFHATVCMVVAKGFRSGCGAFSGVE